MNNKVYDRLANQEAIIDRVIAEAEEGGVNASAMSRMIKEELYAYEEFVDEEKPYWIQMFEWAVPEDDIESDFIVIGSMCYREEDYNNDIYYPIYVISYFTEQDKNIDSYEVEYRVGKNPMRHCA